MPGQNLGTIGGGIENKERVDVARCQQSISEESLHGRASQFRVKLPSLPFIKRGEKVEEASREKNKIIRAESFPFPNPS